MCLLYATFHTLSTYITYLVRCQDKLRMVGGIRTLSETLKSHLNPDSYPDDCDLSLLLHIVRAICAATSGNSMFNHLILPHSQS